MKARNQTAKRGFGKGENMKYTGWSKLEMLGELVLRGKVFTQESAKAATWQELKEMLVESEPAGTDWEEPDAETGRF